MGQMEQIVVEQHGFVLEVRLSNEPYNGLSGTMFREYVEALESASQDDDVRAIVTTSALANWCVGGELGDLSERLSTGTLSDLLHESVGDHDLSLLDRRF